LRTSPKVCIRLIFMLISAAQRVHWFLSLLMVNSYEGKNSVSFVIFNLHRFGHLYSSSVGKKYEGLIREHILMHSQFDSLERSLYQVWRS
jgi:hypothetical protein